MPLTAVTKMVKRVNVPFCMFYYDLKRETETQTHREEALCWQRQSDAPPNRGGQRRQRPGTHCPSEPPRKASPADTMTLDLRPPHPERIHFRCLKPRGLGDTSTLPWPAHRRGGAPCPPCGLQPSPPHAIFCTSLVSHFHEAFIFIPPQPPIFRVNYTAPHHNRTRQGEASFRGSGGGTASAWPGPTPAVATRAPNLAEPHAPQASGTLRRTVRLQGRGRGLAHSTLTVPSPQQARVPFWGRLPRVCE